MREGYPHYESYNANQGNTPLNPSHTQQEPDYNANSLSQLNIWAQWAKQRLTQDQVELQRLREENLQLRQIKDRLEETIVNNHLQIAEQSVKCSDLERAVEGFRALEKLRKTLRVFEIGARVTVIPADTIGKVRKVILDPSGTYYDVEWWKYGQKISTTVHSDDLQDVDLLDMRNIDSGS